MAWTVEIITFKYVKLLLFVQQFFIDFLRIFDIAFFYCMNIFKVIDVKSPDMFFKYQNNSITNINTTFWMNILVPVKSTRLNHLSME